MELVESTVKRYTGGILKACSNTKRCPLEDDCRFWSSLPGRCSWPEEEEHLEMPW